MELYNDYDTQATDTMWERTNDFMYDLDKQADLFIMVGYADIENKQKSYILIDSVYDINSYLKDNTYIAFNKVKGVLTFTTTFHNTTSHYVLKPLSFEGVYYYSTHKKAPNTLQIIAKTKSFTTKFKTKEKEQ